MTKRLTLPLSFILIGLAINSLCSTAAAQHIYLPPIADRYVRAYAAYPSVYPYGAPAIVRREYRQALRYSALYGYPVVVRPVPGPSDFLYRSPYVGATRQPSVYDRGLIGSGIPPARSAYTPYGGPMIPTPSRPQAMSTAKVPSTDAPADAAPEPPVAQPNAASEVIPVPSAEPGPVEF